MPKRARYLFEKICSFENLLAAFYAARKGKRKKRNVAAFEANLDRELFRLKEELENGSYQPGAYRTFKIRDPKERTISAAPFRDRVVHHALCLIIGPLFERSLVSDTYANRNGKGSHAGIKRCQEYMRPYPYVLKADIRKYFPSIDHALLKALIARRIKCQRTLALVFKIIDASNPQEEVLDYFPGDDLFTPYSRRKGLPLGNLTSQYFANWYLSPLDHFIREKLRAPGYARYVDDFVVFAADKATLRYFQQEIEQFLACRLRLRLHPKKTHIFPTSAGITFLGQRIFTTHRRLARINVQRFRKRLRLRLRAYRRGKITPDKFELQLNSWLGHAKQADTFRLRKRIFRQLWLDAGLNLVETKQYAWRLLEWKP